MTDPYAYARREERREARARKKLPGGEMPDAARERITGEANQIGSEDAIPDLGWIIGAIAYQISKISDLRGRLNRDDGRGRELSLAITDLENAQNRVERAQR